MMSYRVLIADDHPMSRQAIKFLLEEDENFILIGEAKNGEEAVELSEKLMPDLILMDINMPDMNGLVATQKIKERMPHIKIVILTVSDNVTDLFTALQYGAQGYLLKNMDPDEWINYLHGLIDDDAKITHKFADRLFHQFKSGNQGPPSNIDILSLREQEILSFVSSGKSNKEIAKGLSISENTVKNHIKNILQKLSLENRVQLTAFAVRNGLTQNVQNNSGK